MINITEDDKLANSTNEWIRIHGIITFTNANYNIKYAENSHETFRKQALHHFRNAGIIEDNGQATNSPNYFYRITKEALKVIKSLESTSYKLRLKKFCSNHTKLIELYSSKKEIKKLPVKINNMQFSFSVGKYNELQKSIIEEFAPRFAPIHNVFI